MIVFPSLLLTLVLGNSKCILSVKILVLVLDVGLLVVTIRLELCTFYSSIFHHQLCEIHTSGIQVLVYLDCYVKRPLKEVVVMVVIYKLKLLLLTMSCYTSHSRMSLLIAKSEFLYSKCHSCHPTICIKSLRGSHLN